MIEGPAILASSSTNGTIAIWDLQERGKVLHTIRDAHEAAVTGLQWVAGQPLLISSSGDNSIKVSFSHCSATLGHTADLVRSTRSNGFAMRIMRFPDYSNLEVDTMLPSVVFDTTEKMESRS